MKLNLWVKIINLFSVMEGNKLMKDPYILLTSYVSCNNMSLYLFIWVF